MKLLWFAFCKSTEKHLYEFILCTAIKMKGFNIDRRLDFQRIYNNRLIHILRTGDEIKKEPENARLEFIGV